jgi:hypothetical protein
MPQSNEYAPWLSDKIDFAKDILYQISDDPDLLLLRSALVMKGATAILLGHHGLRASRNDLDFGLLDHVDVSTDMVDILLADLVDWDARLDTTRRDPIERFPDGSVNVHLAFIHPQHRHDINRVLRFQIQISARRGTVPPRLREKIRPQKMTTWDGYPFEFPILAPEEMVVEKMLRLFRTDKPARHEDLFDIGWLVQRLSLDEGEIMTEFRRSLPREPSCRARRDPIDLLARANVEATFIGKADYGQTPPAEIVGYVAVGITVVLRCVGLK